jgi:hypothetical protein
MADAVIGLGEVFGIESWVIVKVILHSALRLM